MIRYTMTVSDESEGSNQKKVTYGLKATNEKGEEVFQLPSISTNPQEVEYLVERFNQVKIDRDAFQA